MALHTIPNDVVVKSTLAVSLIERESTQPVSLENAADPV